MTDDMLTRLGQVIAAAAVQREIDQQPCKACGGDPLRPAFDGRPECHAPWPAAPCCAHPKCPGGSLCCCQDTADE